jgi:hypothetical protein
MDNPGGGNFSSLPARLGEAPLPAPPTPDRHAAEWGLASLLIGCSLALGAPVTLILNTALAAVGTQIMGPDDVALARVGYYLACLLLIALAGLGIWFGLHGLGLAWRHERPIALPLAGALVCTVALVLWLFTTVDAVFVFEALRDQVARRAR